jgi:hypothetical protein
MVAGRGAGAVAEPGPSYNALSLLGLLGALLEWLAGAWREGEPILGSGRAVHHLVYDSHRHLVPRPAAEGKLSCWQWYTKLLRLGALSRSEARPPSTGTGAPDLNGRHRREGAFHRRSGGVPDKMPVYQE